MRNDFDSLPRMPALATYDLSPIEAAAILRVHSSTLKKCAREGKVRCWSTPGGHLRFRRQDLIALLPPDSGPTPAVVAP